MIQAWSRQTGQFERVDFIRFRDGCFAMMRGFASIQQAKEDLIQRGFPVSRLHTVHAVDTFSMECCADITAKEKK